MTAAKTCPHCGFTGVSIECDCQARIDCRKVGQPGHRQCGVCPEHKGPRFECACLAPQTPGFE